MKLPTRVLNSLIGRGFIHLNHALKVRQIHNSAVYVLWWIEQQHRCFIVKHYQASSPNQYFPGGNEALWLRHINALNKSYCAHLLGQDIGAGILIMQPLQKTAQTLGFYQAAAKGLLHIHQHSEQKSDLRQQFARARPQPISSVEIDTQSQEWLRLIQQHSLDTPSCLIHGNLFATNIICAAQGPCLINADHAHWGDPAMEVAQLVANLRLSQQFAASTEFVQTYLSLIDKVTFESQLLSRIALQLWLQADQQDSHLQHNVGIFINGLRSNSQHSFSVALSQWQQLIQ